MSGLAAAAYAKLIALTTRVQAVESSSGAILAWTGPGHVYTAGAAVTNGGHTYTANDAHTSGATFAGDLAAHWTLLPVAVADVTGAATAASVTTEATARAAADTALSASLAAVAPVGVNGSGAVPLAGRNGKGVDAPSNGTNTDANSRIKGVALRAATGVRVLVGNLGFWGATSQPVNDITVRVGIETSTGDFYPVFFDGRRDVVIEPYGVRLSGVCGVPVIAGETYWVRTRVVVTGGQKWGNNYLTGVTGEGVEIGVGTTTDKTTSGTIAASYAYGYGPLAVLSVPARGTPRWWIGIGDSITDSTSDGGYPGWDGGFLRRFCEAVGAPILNLGLGGEQGQSFALTTAASPGTRSRRALLPGGSYAFEYYGVNDYILSRTLAQIQAAKIALWAQIKAAAIQGIVTGTLPPYTTSTDSFATLVNQTNVGNPREAVRIAANHWMLDGCPMTTGGAAAATGVAAGPTILRAPVYAGATLVKAGEGTGHPLLAVVDLAATVESSVDSGLWKVTGVAFGFTSDGIHPFTGGYAAMATSLQAAVTPLLTSY